MTARIGRRVNRNVYWNDQPLFVAATPELAAEIVSVLNRGSEISAAPGSDGGFPPMPEWHPMSDTPESGCRIVGLYDDGSGAVPLFIYDGGSLDADGGECGPWPIKHLGRWAYLPHDWEFHCEGHPTEPVTISARSPAALARRSTNATGGAARLDQPLIPPNVYYSEEHDNFYTIEDRQGMGTLFWKDWASRKKEFPTSPNTVPTPDPQPQAASEGVREAMQPCSKQEIAAWEEWAKSRHYKMDEHPLHYLFLDPKTDAARMGWKAGLAFALAAITPAGRGADAGDVSKEK